MWSNNHVWSGWEIENDEENYLNAERRQYTMNEQLNLDKWDDLDFFTRFRIHKTTFVYVLDLVRPFLYFIDERYVFAIFHSASASVSLIFVSPS